MDGVAGVGAIPGGGVTPQAYGVAAPTGPAAGASTAELGGVGVAASQSTLSVSSTKMTASVESFIATYGPAMTNQELLGAVLLMLILEYMKSEDSSEKKDLLALIGALAQQQQSQSGGGTIMYNSASFSFESTQMQATSTEMAVGAYSGAASTLQQAPATDPGAAGLNVVA